MYCHVYWLRLQNVTSRGCPGNGVYQSYYGRHGFVYLFVPYTNRHRRKERLETFLDVPLRKARGPSS